LLAECVLSVHVAQFTTSFEILHDLVREVDWNLTAVRCSQRFQESVYVSLDSVVSEADALDFVDRLNQDWA